MRIVDAEAIDRLLDFPSLIAALREMFRDGGRGAAAPSSCDRSARDRSAGAGRQSRHLAAMPAWRIGQALGVKIVTVFPDNGRRGLPSVHGTYLLLDAATGMPEAVLDGTALTLRRTAAASALTAGFLACENSAVHLMVGTGALAPYLIAAHAGSLADPRNPHLGTRSCQGRRPGRAPCRFRDPRRRRTRSRRGRRWRRHHHLRHAVARAAGAGRVAQTRRASRPGRLLSPGRAWGGAGRASAAPACLSIPRRRLREAGDIVQPLRSGALARDRIAGDLFGLARGTCEGRQTADEITLFKSVGTALEDLAAARLAFGRFGA